MASIDFVIRFHRHMVVLFQEVQDFLRLYVGPRLLGLLQEKMIEAASVIRVVRL